MEKYKLQYKSHIQFKNLISHEEFTEVIQPMENKIYDLEKLINLDKLLSQKNYEKLLKVMENTLLHKVLYILL